MTGTFEEACAKVDAEACANAGKSSSDRQAAEDWLAAFAKKSQEALAKRAAEKPVAPQPDEKALVEALAGKDHTEYDRLRRDVAETLGIRVGTLDDKVEMWRKKIEAEDDKGALPHWKVEPWPEPVDGAALLESIQRVFRRYIVLPKSADVALSLWVLHAWTMDADDISPFMVLVSPTKRCGKTSVLILLYFLTPKSVLASNISASALFRYIEAVRPTLLIDEADTFVKDNEELRGILDSGHTKVAAQIIRNVEVDGEYRPRRFSTWAPKAIATIRKLADTLEDRSVIVTLQRKPRDAKVERLRRRDTDEFKRLRSQAARWATDNFASLVGSRSGGARGAERSRRRQLAPAAGDCRPGWRDLARRSSSGRPHPVRRGGGWRRKRRAPARRSDRLRRRRGDPVSRSDREAHRRQGAALGRLEARAGTDAEATRRALETIPRHLNHGAPAGCGAWEGLPPRRLRGGLGGLLSWSKHPSGPTWGFRSVQACKCR